MQHGGKIKVEDARRCSASGAAQRPGACDIASITAAVIAPIIARAPVALAGC